MMIQGSLTVDGSTDWIQLEDTGGVHIAAKGDFGVGTLTIEQRVNGTAYTVQESDDSLVSHTGNFNRHLSFEKHDIFRITLSGSVSPDINYSISGKIGWVYN
jgi:hypothetical protein